MKILLIGVGAAGNKAVLPAVNNNIIDVDNTIIINSTSKDFPKEYNGNKIILSSNGDSGCGKERSIAFEYAKKAISDGKFNLEDNLINSVDTVIIATSVEGGTGSGSTPIIAKYFKQVHSKNVHIFAFTGFNDDVRGLANTIDFFKELDDSFSIHAISNASFLPLVSNNKLKAEELANKAMAEQISVLTGQDFVPGSQNIDDTDIMKLSNTTRYMVVEKKYFDKPLETIDDFEKIIKNMIYNSSSIKSNEPAATRLGIILNISERSEDAIDYDYNQLRDYYGNPFEFFVQKQYDGKKEYIAYIASGMKMPIDELKLINEKYIEESNRLNKSNDEFFNQLQEMGTLSEDASRYNMIKPLEKGVNVADFLNNL